MRGAEREARDPHRRLERGASPAEAGCGWLDREGQ